MEQIINEMLPREPAQRFTRRTPRPTINADPPQFAKQRGHQHPPTFHTGMDAGLFYTIDRSEGLPKISCVFPWIQRLGWILHLSLIRRLADKNQDNRLQPESQWENAKPTLIGSKPLDPVYLLDPTTGKMKIKLCSAPT